MSSSSENESPKVPAVKLAVAAAAATAEFDGKNPTPSPVAEAAAAATQSPKVAAAAAQPPKEVAASPKKQRTKNKSKKHKDDATFQKVKLFSNPANDNDNHYFVVDNLSTTDVSVRFASSNSDNSPNNLTKDNSFKVKPGKRKSVPICTSMMSGWSFTQWGTFRFGEGDKNRVPFSVLCSGWGLTSERDMGIGLCTFDKLSKHIHRRTPKYRQASLASLTFECQLWEDKRGQGYFSWHFVVKDAFPASAAKSASKIDSFEQVIVLVNHAARLDEANPAWGKHSSRPHDSPLSVKGLTQAHQLGRWLRKKAGIKRVDHIITSPMIRCVQTADVLAREYRAAIGTVVVEKGLCERAQLMNKAMEPWFLPVADLCVACPLLDPSARSSLHQTVFARGKRYPGPPIELDGFRNRCKTAATKLLAHKPLKRKTIVLVSHPATNQQWLRVLNPKLEIPHNKNLDCSFTILARKADTTKWKPRGGISSTAHLDGGNETNDEEGEF